MVQAKECISDFQLSPVHNSNSKPQHHVHVDTHPPLHSLPSPEGKKNQKKKRSVELPDNLLSLLCGLLSPDVTFKTNDS